MQLWKRSVVAMAAAGLMLAGGWQAGAHSGSGIQTAHAQAVKNTTRVTIYDSNTTFDAAGLEYQGEWGFGPTHVTVSQGDQVEFDSSSTNSFPHTVTSITWGGSPAARTLDSGTAFNSSPTNDTRIAPGGSWTLDTTALTPGQYVYYCTIHPWMIATLTVEAPGS